MLLLGVLQAQAAGAAPVGAGSFDLLDERVLLSSETSVTFSSLTATYGSTYKHLQIRATVRDSRSSIFAQTAITMNGDTGSNYSVHALRGNGSTVTSNGAANATNINIETCGNTAAGFGGVIFDLVDAFNTNKNKTVRIVNGRAEPGDPVLQITSGMRINTEAITSITLTPSAGASFLTGCRFALYGLKVSA